MTLFVYIVLFLAIAIIALWQKDFFLYLGVGISLIVFGYYLAETSWMEALPVLLLAAYLLYRSIRYWFD